jgi:hypothetical protein
VVLSLSSSPPPQINIVPWLHPQPPWVCHSEGGAAPGRGERSPHHDVRPANARMHSVRMRARRALRAIRGGAGPPMRVPRKHGKEAGRHRMSPVAVMHVTHAQCVARPQNYPPPPGRGGVAPYRPRQSPCPSRMWTSTRGRRPTGLWQTGILSQATHTAARCPKPSISLPEPPAAWHRQALGQ